MPERDVVGLARVHPGQHRRKRAPVGEQVADHGPQLLLGVAVAQVRHGTAAGRLWCCRRRGRGPVTKERGLRPPGGSGGSLPRASNGHRGRSFQGTRVSARGSAGSPSTRSAMMLRRISEVPPSMELPAGAQVAVAGPAAEEADGLRPPQRPVVVDQPAGPGEFQVERGQLLVEPGEDDLRRGALRPRRPRRELLPQPRPGQPGHLGVRPQPDQPVVQARRACLRVLPPGGRGQADHAALPRQRPAADGDPLVHQRGLRDPPAFADAADPVGLGDRGVGEEHLVELGLAGELAQRADLDAGLVHVQAEVGEAGVLGHVRVGAGEQQAPARRVRDGRPHLLAGDPPARTRLPIPLQRTARVARPARSEPAPGSLNSWHHTSSPVHSGRSQRCFCSSLPIRKDRGSRHAQADADPGRVVVRGARRGELGVHRGLERAGQALAAEPGRVVHPGQPGVEPRAQELQPGHRGRVVPGQELADLLAQLGGLVGPGQHSGPPAT